MELRRTLLHANGLSVILRALQVCLVSCKPFCDSCIARTTCARMCKYCVRAFVVPPRHTTESPTARNRYTKTIRICKPSRCGFYSTYPWTRRWLHPLRGQMPYLSYAIVSKDGHLREFRSPCRSLFLSFPRKVHLLRARALSPHKEPVSTSKRVSMRTGDGVVFFLQPTLLGRRSCFDVAPRKERTCHGDAALLAR